MVKANVITVVLHYVKGGILTGEEGYFVVHVEGVIEIATVGIHGSRADYDVILWIRLPEHTQKPGRPVPPGGESATTMKVDDFRFVVCFGFPVWRGENLFIVEPQLIGEFESSLIDQEVTLVAARGDEYELSAREFLENFS